MNGGPHRILIVDDHPLMREGLAVRIGSQPDMLVCGEAASVAEALEQTKRSRPHLVIVDIALADSHGLELIKQIKTRFPAVKMLVVTAYDESLYAERALRAGARGYLNKRKCPEEIIAALRKVLAGQRYLSAELTQRLVEQAVGDSASGSREPTDKLTDRELQVFQLIGQGKTTAQIAKHLHLSVHTIDTHREKIRHKLGLKNAAELMRSAVQWTLQNG